MYSKEFLERVIYQINDASSFLLTTKGGASPIFGFSFDKSRNIEFMDVLMETYIIKEQRSNVICVLAEWPGVAEGIFFSDKAIYVNSTRNTTDNFRIAYENIIALECESSSSNILIIDDDHNVYYIDTPFWNKKSIKIFLEIASGRIGINEANIGIDMEIKDTIDDQISGVVYGNISNASTLYGQDKFSTPRGHGFAAERANHLYDKLTFKDAQIVGDDNVKNGADRVSNGVHIQSKYCSSGSKCIQECFENGKFKYYNTDGSPMQIEVPKDKYEAAIQAMENKIKNGEVPEVTDPSDAKKIVIKGRFTYEQAKNIAKFGTVESIIYDSVNGAIVSAYAFGISTILSFAVSIWNGEDFDNALKKASYSGLQVGGTTFVTAVLSSQLSKAGLNSMLVGSSGTVVRLIGPKASAMIANAFRSGTNIYGAAAMKSAAKLLRTNALTAGVSIVVLSSIDVVNIFRGRISGTQLFKNISNTAASVGGGTAGWVGGAAAGAAIGSAIPVIGTAIGGLVGGLAGAFAGGSLAGKASDSLLGLFIEDDANQMIQFIQDVFKQLAEEYLLTQSEAEQVVDLLKKDLTGSKLKDMFASNERTNFARKLLIPLVENVVRNRQQIHLPSNQEMIRGLRNALEEIADLENLSQTDSK